MEISGAEAGVWMSLRNASFQAAQEHITAVRSLGGVYSIVVASNLEGYVFFSERTNGQKRRVVLQRDSIEEPLGFEIVGPERFSSAVQHQGVFVVQVDPLGTLVG